MKDSTINKMAGGVIALIIFIIVCFVGLIGWGFIEIVQWITSK